MPFIPENELERALVAAVNNPAAAPEFYRLLLQSDLLVLGTVEGQENAKSQFAENNGIYSEVPLMCAKPRHHTRIGRWFRRLAQDVGVNQVLHSASVDSESMGTKKSFRGQVSSQSMAPSLCGAARRTRR